MDKIDRLLLYYSKQSDSCFNNYVKYKEKNETLRKYYLNLCILYGKQLYSLQRHEINEININIIKLKHNI